MKRLIADLYKIVYKVTNAHMASLLFSIAFVSTLNYISLYGIGLLLERNAAAKIIHKLVSFPVSVGTFIVIFLLNLWLMTPLKNLSKERKKQPFYPSIIAYTLVCIVLLIFIHYRDRLPN